MPSRQRTNVLPLLLCVLAVAGCGFLSDDAVLEEFRFEESTHGTVVEPSIDATGLSGQILLIGQLNTPSACHSLRGALERSGSRLTLRVTAREETSACGPGVGTFRYTAAIRFLSAGTYQLRVRHVFEGSDWETDEFNLNITVS